MNLGLNMSMDMRLEQKLSPQMIQSLKLLQVSALELEALVKQELEQNPVLEIEDGDEVRAEPELDRSSPSEEPARSSEDGDEGGEGGETRDNGEPSDLLAATAREEDRSIDWESYFDDGFDLGQRLSEERDDSEETFERVPVHQKSMEEHLLDQLNERHFPAELRPFIEYLIGNLDENGFLEAPMPEILERLSIDEDTFAEALHVLQGLDPAGIAARDLRECLQLQLIRAGKRDSLPWRIVSECFGLLQKLKLPTIARRLDTPVEEIQSAVREISRLEPRPARILSNSVPNTVVPDLVVEKGPDGEFVVSFNDRTVPSLRISRSYQDMLRKGSRASTEEKKYVRDKLNSASWLIRSIEQRKGTMLKVMYAIIEAQPAFFDKGPAFLRPLVLQQVADRVGMHISTVSRVTNEKYVQTPWGVFELKYFFTAAVQQEDGSEISSVEARDAIQRLIEEEDPSAPFSDQKIVDELEKKGVHVARRTVAKYRDMMGILPARMRRRF